MSVPMTISVDLPETLGALQMPDALQKRLQRLLDHQDDGRELTAEEREEAEALVHLSDLLTLLRAKARER